MTDGPRKRALGAYIFAGGFTVGVSRHFDVVAHLEANGYGVPTASANFPTLPIHVGQENWPLDALSHEGIDFVYGNPPCAAWSQAGRNSVQGGDWRTDPRVSCTRVHFDLLRRLRPRVWAWESVPRAFTVGRDFVDELTREALGMGYSVSYVLHNAKYLGLAQDRPRFFFVAHDREFSVEVPDWTTYPASSVLAPMNDIGPLDMRLQPHLEELFPLLKPGGSLREAWAERHPPETWVRNDHGQVVGRPPFTYHRTYWDRPSNTIAGFNLIHPKEDRCLTTTEMAALCGFPRDYIWVGSGIQNQVARGVCPPVGEWLARNVLRCLEADVPVQPRVWLLDCSKPPGTVTSLYGPAVTVHTPTEAPVSEILIEQIVGFEPIPIAVDQDPRIPIVAKDGERSGDFIRRLIDLGLSNDEIAFLNKESFPASKATEADVKWHRSKLRQERGQSEPHVVTHPKMVISPEEDPVGRFRVETPTEPSQTATEGCELVPPAEAAVPQPTRRGASREAREFDTTSLTEKSHGGRVHRDYAAHWFRWGWVSRHIQEDHDVLDVGCGADFPFVKVLVGAYADGVPRSYLGVDLNPLTKPPYRPWANFRGDFNFVDRHWELGRYDRIVCLEVIEHMLKEHGVELLWAMGQHLKPGGKIFLSTPVFNGKAAANHIHEWTIPELWKEVEGVGLRVIERFGTFANLRDVKRVATPEQVRTLDALNRFYSTGVTACFLAPLYPDAARNNMWILGDEEESCSFEVRMEDRDLEDAS